MSNYETIEQNRASWDTISANYQASTRISTDDVHYSPLAPGERELCLLSDGPVAPPKSVAGKQILEIGCGGGQNSIALARWGATCIGIDPSSAQLDHARRLAAEHGVDVQFNVGIAEDLDGFEDDTFDAVLSSYAFDYVTDLKRAYAEVRRVLKPGGLFVFCMSHPWFQAVGWHLAGDPDAPKVADYAAWPDIEEWDWSYQDGTSAPMRGHLRKLEQIVNQLVETGFSLECLVEQHQEDAIDATAEDLPRFPYVHIFDPESEAHKLMRKLPRTVVVRARKARPV